MTYPETFADPLGVLNELQSIFVIRDQKYYPLCFTTNERGMFKLTAKGGWITFYDAKDRFREILLEGRDLVDILKKFFREVRSSSYCNVHMVKCESGNTNQTKIDFKIWYKYEEGKIELKDYSREYFGGSGCDGDL